MQRLIYLSAMLFSAALLAGCAGAPGVGGTPGPIDADTARTALCASGSDTSLSGLATQLDGITDDTDVSAINTAIGTTISDLQSAELDTTEGVVRDAAVTALTELQSAINDPATRSQAASQAATALRAADTQIC